MLPPKLAAIADAFGDDPDAPDPASPILAEGSIWLWRSKDPNTTAAWHFVTIQGPPADAIRAAARGLTGGFGSIKVEAAIDDTRWKTSLFPHKETGGYFLPVKADVRRKAGVGEGDQIAVSIMVVAPGKRRSVL